MVCVATSGCTPSEPNDLDALGKVQLTIAGRPFELWIADDFAEQQRGLMFVSAEQMAPKLDGVQRGMLFVFSSERTQSATMANTRIPLDIAYLDSDGLVVKTYTMTPFDTRLGVYASGEPVKYAIEVNAGQWAELGVKAGETTIEMPASLP